MPRLQIFIATILPLLLFILPTYGSLDEKAQRLPLGGSLLNLEPRGLLPRADGDLGNDCGGDPDCTTTDWGCQCGFTDGSWITEKEDGDGESGGTCKMVGGEALVFLFLLCPLPMP